MIAALYKRLKYYMMGRIRMKLKKKVAIVTDNIVGAVDIINELWDRLYAVVTLILSQWRRI